MFRSDLTENRLYLEDKNIIMDNFDKYKLEQSFIDNYTENIRHVVRDIELERIKLRSEISKVTKRKFLVSGIIIVMVAFCLLVLPHSIWDIKILLLYATFIILIICSSQYYNSEQEKWKNKICEKFIPELLKPFGEFEWINPNQCNDIIKLEDISASGLLNLNANYIYKIDNDRIAGTYNNLPLKILETKISTQDHTNINGLVIYTELNKATSAHTIITTNPTYVQQTKDREEVILEDVEINNIYSIFSSDQVEARYILTPQIIERLKDVSELFSTKDISIAYYGKNKVMIIIYENNVYTDDNYFFLGDLSHSTCNMYNLKNFAKEFISILSVIEELKLCDKYMPPKI